MPSLLAEHGLVGSMGRRGNPYDNAKAESFMKTLKVEAVYLMDYETLRLSTGRSLLLSRPTVEHDALAAFINGHSNFWSYSSSLSRSGT